MGRGSSIAKRFSAGALALAALAIALRIMVPGGYMVAPSASRGALPSIVICTGQGALTLAVDAAGHPLKPGDKTPGQPTGSHDDHPCSFAAAAAPLATPVAEVLPAPAVQPADLPAAGFVHQRPGLGLAAPPPQPTGPPSII